MITKINKVLINLFFGTLLLIVTSLPANPGQAKDCFTEFHACSNNCAQTYKKCSCQESGCEAQLLCCESKCNDNEKCLKQCYKDYRVCTCKRDDCCNAHRPNYTCTEQYQCCQLQCEDDDFNCLEKCAQQAAACKEKTNK